MFPKLKVRAANLQVVVSSSSALLEWNFVVVDPLFKRKCRVIAIHLATSQGRFELANC